MKKKRSRQKCIEEANWHYLQSNLVDHIYSIAKSCYTGRHNNGDLSCAIVAFRSNSFMCACVYYLYQFISIFTQNVDKDKLIITKFLHQNYECDQNTKSILMNLDFMQINYKMPVPE